jgi:hypothetical protein
VLQVSPAALKLRYLLKHVLMSGVQLDPMVNGSTLLNIAYLKLTFWGWAFDFVVDIVSIFVFYFWSDIVLD